MGETRSPQQMIYDYCKEKGICVTCKSRFSNKDNLRCEKCRVYHNKHQKKSFDQGSLPTSLRY